MTILASKESLRSRGCRLTIFRSGRLPVLCAKIREPETPDPETPEPETPVDPDPPAGDPVPADQAPQGTNQFGWPLLTDVGLQELARCESGNRHDINTGNGFYGAVQWLPATLLT